MILKYGNAGGSIEISDAPKITFSGKWKTWAPEFYGGVLYWEAWFFTSGTLTFDQTYTVDAWGIGGGGGSKGYVAGGGGGQTNMVTGLELSGAVAVTIGAGAQSSDAKGGATALGSYLTCAGGALGPSGGQSSERYRFSDPDKVTEAGDSPNSSGAGWLPLQSASMYNGGTTLYPGGQGFGGGGADDLCGHPGALVVRILA